MTKDDVIRMAEACGIPEFVNNESQAENIMRFAELVRADERARLAEQPEQHQDTADKSKLETVPAKGSLLPAQQEPVDSTQISKVWWDGEKLMAKPVPFVEFYKPAQQEPEYWLWACGQNIQVSLKKPEFPDAIPLYTRPQARKPLSAGNMPPEVDEMRKAALELGDWLSAALDDKYVCLEYKQAINNWFNCAMPYPPAQRTWVGLTDEEILDKCEVVPDFDIGNHDLIEFARAIEAKLKEKNT